MQSRQLKCRVQLFLCAVAAGLNWWLLKATAFTFFGRPKTIVSSCFIAAAVQATAAAGAGMIASLGSAHASLLPSLPALSD